MAKVSFLKCSLLLLNFRGLLLLLNLIGLLLLLNFIGLRPKMWALIQDELKRIKSLNVLKANLKEIHLNSALVIFAKNMLTALVILLCCSGIGTEIGLVF